MAINDGFVTAVGPDGRKRRVPTHYLSNPALGFRLPPSARKELEGPLESDPEPVELEDPADADDEGES